MSVSNATSRDIAHMTMLAGSYLVMMGGIRLLHLTDSLRYEYLSRSDKTTVIAVGVICGSLGIAGLLSMLAENEKLHLYGGIANAVFAVASCAFPLTKKVYCCFAKVFCPETRMQEDPYNLGPNSPILEKDPFQVVDPENKEEIELV